VLKVNYEEAIVESGLVVERILNYADRLECKVALYAVGLIITLEI
jgi:hypothetical protein